MRKLAACALLSAIALAPALATAQTSVTVLGLRSAAADEEAARQVTDALRLAAESATSESGLLHTGRENDLSQLLIAFGCDEPTPACLRQIGEGLSSERLIYGRVERRPGRGDPGYTVTLAYFDVRAGAVERTLQEVLPAGALAGEAILRPVSRFFASLTGSRVPGELAIRVPVEGATVLVNGSAVGTSSSEPLVLRDLAPGEVTVAVRADRYQPYSTTVRVESGLLTELTVELEPRTLAGPVGPTGGEGGQEGGEGGEDDVVTVPFGGESRPRPHNGAGWLAGGWTAVGLGLVFAGLGIWATAEVGEANSEDSLLGRERACWAGPGGITFTEADAEACEGVVAGRHEDYVDDVFDRLAASESLQPRSSVERSELFAELDRVQLFQTLQFVFYGLAAASAGVGLYLLITEYSRAPADETAGSGSALRLSVSPMVWQGGAALTGLLRF